LGDPGGGLRRDPEAIGGAGVLVGLLGVAALELVGNKIGVRRDCESLYSLGVAFAAFAAVGARRRSGQGVGPQATGLVSCLLRLNERSHDARVAQELRQAGWRKARALTGGWAGWQAAGLPVKSIRPSESEIDPEEP
jgi:hypothetical protein